MGISRILAAFHLDRLVRAGLLDTVYRRLSGRTGPGAGRTSKLYRRAARQFRLSLPERRYELLARLLAQALAGEPGASATTRLSAAATRLGARLGQEASEQGRRTRAGGTMLTAALRTLGDHGFEPRQEGAWITLQNCPFDAVASDHRELVCGVNLSLMRGFAHALGGVEARLSPDHDGCCVRLHAGPAERKNE